jgi:SAM-dependent methyltransferase
VQPTSAVQGTDKIKTILQEHPFVASVSVVEEEGPDGRGYSVAYVLPSSGWLSATMAQAAASNLQKQINGWHRIFDRTYRNPTENAPGFVGWTSSYTNQPLPAGEMREWLDATIGRIVALEPRRVLEIGCGVGLLVEALAPRCAAYCGTDFSDIAIQRLRQFTAARAALRHVELLQREAIDFDGMAPESVDTVVLNSVIQYFPNLDYLEIVLDRAAQVVECGGHIFVGDVRHLGLLPAFHCSVQLSKALPASTIRSLKRKIALAIEQERELVIDPQFFRRFARRHPRIAGAAILLKTGDADNELTRYRYDVVLQVDGARSIAAREEPMRDAAEGVEEVGTGLRQCDLRRRTEEIALARDDFAALRLLESADDRDLVRDLQTRVAAFENTDPIDTQVSLHLSHSAAYRPGVGRSSGPSDSGFDITVLEPGRPSTWAPPPSPYSERANSASKPLATDPVAVALRNQLGFSLGQFVRSRLPESCLPAAVIVLSDNPVIRQDEWMR